MAEITQEQIEKRQREQETEDAAARQAAGKPLPGPTADAFAPQPEIKVGEYSVRPFCDADFETLQFLDSPLVKMMAAAFGGQKSEEDGEKIIRKVSHGQHAWDICYVLTTPADEVDSLLKTGGADAVKAAAKKKFGNRLPTGAVIKIVMAAIDQMNKSWETMLGYGAPEDKKEGASGGSNPPQSGQP
jgi:hypothetical protein